MTDLPPDVRDAAAQAAWERANGTDGPFGWADLAEDEREAWRDGVDAVAEVLAEQPAHEFTCPACGAVTRARMADAEQPDEASEQARQWRIAQMTENDALKARVDLLTTALTELVSLKDGPRDENYRTHKDDAWANARAVLSATPTESEAPDEG